MFPIGKVGHTHLVGIAKQRLENLFSGEKRFGVCSDSI